MESLTAAMFQFGDFELDCARRLLTSNGEPVALTAKTFDLLRHLVENHGRVLSKSELLDRIWPDQFVEENNLSVQIAALRKVFGDKAGSYRFITTVPGKGYSFIEAVERTGIQGTLTSNASVGRALSEHLRSSGSIIGRAKEIAEIKGLLRDGVPRLRLVVLTGPGGSGKTKLALSLANELSTHYRNGVFFVELAAIDDPGLVVSEIARSLGLKESSGCSPIEVVTEFLRERQSLLILDNFEQVISATPVIRELLEASSTITILVTSRVALRLHDEREFTVMPLSVPPKSRKLTPEQLYQYPACNLFVSFARKTNPNFSLSGSNAHAVAEICRKLDGLPLAIELAAARVRLLSSESILSRLENSLKLLTGGSNDLPERQRTIRATIAWSYDLLDDNSKALFRRLAVFAGGFSVEAAEAVANAGLDDLTLLVDSNLLVARSQADDSFRLNMLEVVREFALECLEESGETAGMRSDHADFFRDLAVIAEPHLFTERSVEWLEKLDLDIDNLRGALGWLLENDAESASGMVAALRQYWSNRNHLAESRGWLSAALEKSSNEPSVARYKLLNAYSLAVRHQGDFSTARTAAQESLALSRSSNDLRQMVLSCQAVSALETLEGNFTVALELILESLEISRQLNDEKQIAFSLAALGDVRLAQGQPLEARAPIEESLEISGRLGFRSNVCVNLINLGTVAWYEGDAESAHKHFSASLVICREMMKKNLISCCLDGFAAVASIKDNNELAAALAGAADGLRESIGYEIELTERLFRDKYLAHVRTCIGDSELDAFHARGRAIEIDDAIAIAIDPRLLESCWDFEFDHKTDGNYGEKSINELVIENRTIERIVIDEKIDTFD